MTSTGSSWTASPAVTPVCFNPVSGAQLLPPGQHAIVRVGFDSSDDPTRAELLVETHGPPVPLVPAPS